jgi:quercetin dioxygenase-like cupin family protein
MDKYVESVLQNLALNDDAVNKVNNFTGADLTVDTYYFNPGQILAYHRHPNGDQSFFIIKGEGKFYLDNGSESVVNVTDGSIVYVPKGVWHKLENAGNDIMVACQSTAAGAGMEAKQ